MTQIEQYSKYARDVARKYRKRSSELLNRGRVVPFVIYAQASMIMTDAAHDIARGMKGQADE